MAAPTAGCSVANVINVCYCSLLFSFRKTYNPPLLPNVYQVGKDKLRAYRGGTTVYRETVMKRPI